MTAIRAWLHLTVRVALRGADGAADWSTYWLRIAHEPGTDAELICLLAHRRAGSQHDAGVA